MAEMSRSSRSNSLRIASLLESNKKKNLSFDHGKKLSEKSNVLPSQAALTLEDVEWSQEETQLLFQIHAMVNPREKMFWKEVAKKMGKFSALECQRKYENSFSCFHTDDSSEPLPEEEEEVDKENVVSDFKAMAPIAKQKIVKNYLMGSEEGDDIFNMTPFKKRALQTITNTPVGLGFGAFKAPGKSTMKRLRSSKIEIQPTQASPSIFKINADMQKYGAKLMKDANQITKPKIKKSKSKSSKKHKSNISGIVSEFKKLEKRKTIISNRAMEQDDIEAENVEQGLEIDICDQICEIEDEESD